MDNDVRISRVPFQQSSSSDRSVVSPAFQPAGEASENLFVLSSVCFARRRVCVLLKYYIFLSLTRDTGHVLLLLKNHA